MNDKEREPPPPAMGASSGKSATTARGPAVACPHCGTPALYSPANAFRPFCSERCRLIDLGAWAKESYRIPDSAPADGTLDDDVEER